MDAIRDCAKVRQIWLASGLLVEDRVWEVSDGWELKWEVIGLVNIIAWLI